MHKKFHVNVDITVCIVGYMSYVYNHGAFNKIAMNQ